MITTKSVVMCCFFFNWVCVCGKVREGSSLHSVAPAIAHLCHTNRWSFADFVLCSLFVFAVMCPKRGVCGSGGRSVNSVFLADTRKIHTDRVRETGLPSKGAESRVKSVESAVGKSKKRLITRHTKYERDVQRG